MSTLIWKSRGRKAVLKTYEREPQKNETVPFTEEDRRTVMENLEQNVLATARANPQVTFYYFIPPYSISWWDSELMVKGEFERQMEGYRLYSAVGAAGELFAVRRELFEPMEPDTLLDDFILSLRIAMKGYTIAYCTNAYAIESGSADMGEEEKRKVRIAAGGLQSIWRLRPLLNPFHYGILSFQYTSHRVLRWSVTPFLLFALLPLNIVVLLLGESPLFYGTLLGLQILFYGMGYWGYYLSTRQIKNKVLFIPYYFLFMNVNVLKGIGYLKRKKGSGAWEKAKRAEK